MSTTYVRSASQAIQMVELVLEHIKAERDKFNLVIIGITRATGGLMRHGVSFIVTIMDTDSKLTIEVPLRVESPYIVQYRFCTQEMLKCWKRKKIHAILSKWLKEHATLAKKVAGCLKIALNHFRRKLQHLACLAKCKMQKVARRAEKYRGFVRPDACMMHH